MKKSKIIKDIAVEKADAVLLKVPYEATVSGDAGTARGPFSICDMLDYQVEDWDCFLEKTIHEKVRISKKDLKVKKMSPQKMIDRVEKEYARLLDKGKFVALLGGEHTVSIGAIKAAKKFFKKLTVVQIDAHADLRDNNSDYEDNPRKVTEYAHSCVMRRIHEMGCDLVQIGIRSMSPMEHEFIRKRKMGKNVFYAPVESSFREIVSRCETKKVYLTIDVDGFDPSVMPATGTPEPGGLSWDWSIGFFRELFSRKEVVGLDIVEVAPRKGDILTEFVAAKLLYHLIGLKFSRE